jgi:hypothetical protein
LANTGGVFQGQPYDPTQGLTNVQEAGLGTMGQGTQQLQQAQNIATSAWAPTQTAANTMGQGVNTMGQALGQQNQAIGLMNQANPAVQGLGNVGSSQLYNILSGNNLNPATNPYLAATAQAANEALINQYTTATAPSLMAQAMQAGGGGPGSLQGSAFGQAQGIAQQALGQELGNQITNIYGQNYANAQNQITQGLGLVGATQAAQYAPTNEALAAAQALLGTGQAQVGAGVSQLGVPQQILQQAQLQGNLGNELVSAGATGFGAGTTQYGQQNQAIDQLLGVGTLQQQQQQQGFNQAYQNALAANQYPMNMLSQFGGILGQATGGMGNQMTVGTTSK